MTWKNPALLSVNLPKMQFPDLELQVKISALCGFQEQGTYDLEEPSVVIFVASTDIFSRPRFTIQCDSPLLVPERRHIWPGRILRRYLCSFQRCSFQVKILGPCRFQGGGIYDLEEPTIAIFESSNDVLQFPDFNLKFCVLVLSRWIQETVIDLEESISLKLLKMQFPYRCLQSVCQSSVDSRGQE